jgi:glutathione S-transferase
MKRPVNEALVAEHKAKLQTVAVLAVYETHLAMGESKYLVGGAYSLADACHAPYVVMIAELTPEVVTELPRVVAWMQRVMARPAVKQCMSRLEPSRAPAVKQ